MSETHANTQLAKTPLHALHQELGAKLVPFAGYEMALQYPGGIINEHTHTRTQAGLFDVSHMGQIRLSGPEAAAAVSQTSLQQAEDSLRKLYALSLCQLASSTPGQTRYRLHPLLSRYAEETAVSRDYLTQAQLRLINFYIDYGEKHHDNTRLLTTEISNIRAVLQLTKTYDLPDAYRRGTAVFASVLK